MRFEAAPVRGGKGFVHAEAGTRMLARSIVTLLSPAVAPFSTTMADAERRSISSKRISCAASVAENALRHKKSFWSRVKTPTHGSPFTDLACIRRRAFLERLTRGGIGRYAA